MIFIDYFRFSFVSFCVIMIVTLTFLILDLIHKKHKYYKAIIRPIALAIYTTFVYSLFFISKNHAMAVFFDALYFIGTDWIAMAMLFFGIEYTGIASKYRKSLFILFMTLCSIDSILLLINNFTHHMFDLFLMEGALNFQFWGNNFKWPHYLHLGLCYLMVALTFIFFIISSIKAARNYKMKYFGIIAAYMIAILLNMISYSVNLSVDISIFLYAAIAGFCWYFTTYSFPHNLLYQSLRTVNETIADAVICFDIYGHCIYANKVAKEIFTKDGRFSKKKVELYRRNCLDSAGLSEETFSIECEDFTIGGQVHHYSVEFQKEYLDNAEIGSCLMMFDKTKEVDVFLKEKYIATHDELTGLLNREGFFEAVDKIVSESGTEDYLMMASNIKDFKLINELFGEKLGDEVLIMQSQLYKGREGTVPSAVYARISDDKFGLYIKKSEFSSQMIKDKINELKQLTKSTIYQMHFFIGVYELNGQIERAQSMYDKAVMAITNLSNDYSETFAYYDSALMDKLLNEKNIEKDFIKAIEKNQIEMYLQPIINTKMNTYGAEALARWNHPLRGLMLPSDFLEILEKTGLIYHLDEYIWKQAASKLHEWKEQGYRDCYISVNVSRHDNYYIDVYKVFTQLVEEYEIEASSLHVEITEDFLMADFVRFSELVMKLKAYGFVVVIDDFGFGRSSLNMLKDFDADILKIDKSLLAQASVDKRSQIILEEIMNMAKLLEVEIVGLGVENREKYDILNAGKCYNFQGNYISEPLSVSDFENRFIQYSIK